MIIREGQLFKINNTSVFFRRLREWEYWNLNKYNNFFLKVHIVDFFHAEAKNISNTFMFLMWFMLEWKSMAPVFCTQFIRMQSNLHLWPFKKKLIWGSWLDKQLHEVKDKEMRQQKYFYRTESYSNCMQDYLSR